MYWSLENVPWTNLHDLNLDWIVNTMKQTVEQWIAYRLEMDGKFTDFTTQINSDFDEFTTGINEWKTLIESEFSDLQTYVQNYFDNLDLNKSTRYVINQMIASGEFIQVLNPSIVSATEAWLASHVTPTTPVVDDTLTIAGAAADAKATGDRITTLNSNLNNALTTDAQLLNNDINNNALYIFPGYIHSSGKWIVNSAYNFILVIVKPGDIIKIKKNATTNAIIGWLKSFNFENNVPADFVNETSLITISDATEQQYTAPDTVKYIYIAKSAGSGSVNYLPSNVTVNDIDRLQTANQRMLNNINEALEEPNFDNILLNNDVNGNGFCYTSIGYIHSNGTWAGANTGTHCIIKVSPGDSIKIRKNNNAPCFYAWFSKYDGYDFGKRPPYVDGTALTQISNDTAVDITAPEGSKYLYLHNIIANVTYFPATLEINGTDRTHTIIGKVAYPVCIIKASANSITVITGKGSHTITHQIIASKNLDTWRLTKATVNDYSLWSEVDVEGPVKLENETDYITGYHGDEILTNVTFLVDGNSYDFDNTQIGNRVFCNNFTTCVETDVYHDTSTTNKAFVRYKRLVFSRNKLEIYNTYKCVDSNGVNVEYATGSGLYPASTDVVTGYTTNTRNKLVSEESTGLNKWLDSVSYFGNDFTINIHVLFGKLEGYYGRVDYIQSQTRYKLYFFQHHTSGNNYLHLANGDELYSGYAIEFE